MTKLTDAQLTLLRAVANAGSLAPPSQRSTKAVATRLIAMKLLARDEEGSLEQTDEGRSAIEAADAGQESPAQDNPGETQAPTPRPPKGKLGLVVEMLRRSEGATIAQMGVATGWQAHSVRGAISGAVKKKLGLTVTSDATEAGRIYRIVEAGQMSLEEAVSAEVASLAGLNIEALRIKWRARFGAPPRLRSGEILRRLLAERIQAEAYGDVAGLAPKLAQLARSYERSGRAAPPRAAPRPGTILLREHAGVTHRVESTVDGYIWQGRSYRSLSRIAREITGVQWSGPAFFGVPSRRAA